MREADGQCLTSPHRQSRQRAVLAVSFHRVVRLNERNNILEQIVLEGATRSWAAAHSCATGASTAPARKACALRHEEAVDALSELPLIQGALVLRIAFLEELRCGGNYPKLRSSACRIPIK